MICIRSSGSFDHEKNRSGSAAIVWQNQTAVFQQMVSDGTKLSFVFDVPASCVSSIDSEIQWQVIVEGYIEGLGTFTRTWEVALDENPQESSLHIPLDFTEKYEKKEQQKAYQASEKNISSISDDQHFEYSTRTISTGSGIAGFVIATMIGAIGAYTFMQGWGAGVVFILVGVAGAAASVYAANKVIQIKIDKQQHTLLVDQRLFGINRSTQQLQISSPEQFVVEELGGGEEEDNQISMYTVKFIADGVSIKLSGWIEGDRAAKALRDRVVEQIYPPMKSS